MDWAPKPGKGNLRLTFPSGNQVQLQGKTSGPNAEVEFLNTRTIRRIWFGGSLGLAEGYMAGDWKTPNLPCVLAFGAANDRQFDGSLKSGSFTRTVRQLGHWLRRNSCTGSKRNIHAHYDLGNDFFRLGLIHP